MSTHNCPICKKSLTHSPRYPNYICRQCVGGATDAKGRKVAFFNTGFDGGFAGSYQDSKEAYNSHQCFIDGKECYAKEARFGGIVVQLVEARNK